MPYTKITTGKDKGKYKSPRGSIRTLKQVQAYYAKKNGTKRKRRVSTKTT